MYSLGCVELARGRFSQARSLFTNSLKMQQTSQRKRGRITSLVGFASLAAAHGNAERALRLLGATEAALESLPMHLEFITERDFENARAAARGALSEEAFATAWATGRAMTLERAVQYATEETTDV